MNKGVLQNKIKSLYKEHQLYVKFFEEEKQKVEDKKQSIVKALQEGKEFEAVEKELEFLLFGFQTKVADMNILSNELVSLYNIAKQSELDLEMEKETIEVLDKMLVNKRKLTFIPEKDGLKERVKGSQEEYMQNVKSSEHYKNIKEQLINNLG